MEWRFIARFAGREHSLVAFRIEIVDKDGCSLKGPARITGTAARPETTGRGQSRARLRIAGGG
jgi:hypothetical protein